jgi:hypothetical protein
MTVKLKDHNKFWYYYKTTQEDDILKRRVTVVTVGHLMVDECAAEFLCGRKKTQLKYCDVRPRALPGRKLCAVCVRKRRQIASSTPTNIKNWWVDGRKDHNQS